MRPNREKNDRSVSYNATFAGNGSNLFVHRAL